MPYVEEEGEGVFLFSNEMHKRPTETNSGVVSHEIPRQSGKTSNAVINLDSMDDPRNAFVKAGKAATVTSGPDTPETNETYRKTRAKRSHPDILSHSYK